MLRPYQTYLRSFWRTLAALCVLAVSACAPTQTKPATDAAPPPQSGEIGVVSGPGVDEAAAAACHAKGGAYQQVCLMGKFSCVMTYADAGKACTDGSQCESGRCMAEYAATDNPKEAVKGVCKQTSNPCGCFSLMEDGKPQPALCVD